MAFIRIAFNTTDSDIGAYTIPLNPSFVDMQDSSAAYIFETLDGGSVIQDQYFDARPRLLKWVGIPKTFSNFPTLLQTLEGYRGSVKFVKFNSADTRVTPETWTKYRVGNLKVTARSGGNIKYDVELMLIPEN